MKQHKWSKEIKAWSDGAEIEMRCQEPSINKKTWSKWETFDGEWTEENWWEFRIKSLTPQPVEPQYLYVYKTKKGIELTDRYYGYTMDEYIGKIPLIVESNDD